MWRTDPKGGPSSNIVDPLKSTGLVEFTPLLSYDQRIFSWYMCDCVSSSDKKSIFLIRLAITCVTSIAHTAEQWAQRDPLRGVYEIDPSLTFAEKKGTFLPTLMYFFLLAGFSSFFNPIDCVFFLGFGHNSKTVASFDVPPFRVRWKRRLAVITDPTKIR